LRAVVCPKPWSFNRSMNTPILAPLGGDAPKLRMADLVRLTGATRPTIRAMIARGEFPRGIRVCGRVHTWPEPVVRAWIAEREAGARTNG
jgi:prophage regulatory protein